MDVEPSIAPLGALIAVPARAHMLAALFDGRALTASELAYAARITPQTASSHLAKLVDASLLVVERHGRFRYYKLAGPEVADALEPLTLISPHRPVPVRGHSKEVMRLRSARFCNDHIAGHLGVLMTDALVARAILDLDGRNYRLTPKGVEFCEDLGLEPAKLSKQRRALARPCLDWSERRPHLAGALGAALARVFVERRWIVRAKEGRVVSVTNSGRTAFQNQLGLQL